MRWRRAARNMRAWSQRHAARQQRAGSAGAPGDRAREQISSRPRRARRHHRADADQARRPRAASATPATPRACAIPTPISPGASNTSPAPIAPPTAITAAPCVIMRAAITMPPSASGRSGRCRSRRCSRASAPPKIVARPAGSRRETPADANARAGSRANRACSATDHAAGQRHAALRCVRGTTCSAVPAYSRVDTPPNGLH